MYLVARRNRARSNRAMNRVATRNGMGDFDWNELTTDILGVTPIADAIKEYQPIVDANCLAKANQYAAPIDMQVDDINKNWTPNGYFSPDQVEQIMAVLQPQIIAALALVQAAKRSTSDADQIIAERVHNLQGRLGTAPGYDQTVNKYLSAATEAKVRQVRVIDAPGMKKFVLGCLRAVSDAYVARSMLDCEYTFLDTLGGTFAKIRDVLLGLVQVVVEAGEAVLEVASTTISILKYAKWGALGLGAYWVYREGTKRKWW